MMMMDTPVDGSMSFVSVQHFRCLRRASVGSDARPGEKGARALLMTVTAVLPN